MPVKRLLSLIFMLLITVNLSAVTTNIAVVGDNTGVIKYYEINSDGTIGKVVFIEDIGDNVWGVGCEDFNQDGLPDIVSGSPNDGKIYLYVNQGINAGNNYYFNRITIASNIDMNNYMLDFGVGDFNNDGYPDFVCSGNTTTPLVFINNQNNSFSIQALTPTTYYLRGKDTGDFDEDNDVDIVVGEYSSGDLYMYRNNNYNTFTKIKIGTVPECNSPYTVIAGDFDEDGHLDIIAGGDVYGDTYFFKGKGNGSFAIPEDFQTPLVDGNPYGTPFDFNTYAAGVSFDLDKDVHFDIIAVNSDKYEISTIKGKGDGSFEEPYYEDTTYESALGISFFQKKYYPRNQFPDAQINNPSITYQWCTNHIIISGTASDPNSDFSEYTLFYGEGIYPIVWNKITNNNTAVPGGTLGIWDASNLNGIYTIKLVVKDAKGNLSGDEAIVNVNNKITTATQNYVVTLNGEVVEPGGVILAGKGNTQTGLISRKIELETIKRELAEIEKEIEASMNEKSIKTKEIE